MAKSFNEILTDLITNVKASMGNVDTRVGTILRDAFLTPEAAQFLDAYTTIDTVSANQGVNTAQVQSDAALENLAANYGLSRFSGTYASGMVTFYRYTQPSGNISIPAGTIVSTESSAGRVTFKTITAAILGPASDFDAELNAWYVNIFVICDITGTLGNVTAGGINYVALPGVDGVTNKNDLAGGRDSQTNDELVALIKSTARGNLGTRTGYESMVRENFAVDDVEIITPDDSDFVRTSQIGAIDVIILNNDPITAEEDLPYVNSVVTTQLVPSYLPLLNIGVLTGEGVTGGAVTLTEGATGDFEVVYDTFSDYRRSQIEKSRIILHTTKLKNDSMINLKYDTSAMVASVQSFLEREENKAIGSNIIVKMGIKLPALVAAKIRLVPGYTSSAVITDIKAALKTYFDSLLLDNDIQSSDVISVITAVSGVDSVNVPDFKLSLASSPTEVVQEIVAGKQEYIRLADEPTNPDITVEV